LNARRLARIGGLVVRIRRKGESWINELKILFIFYFYTKVDLANVFRNGYKTWHGVSNP